MPRNHYFTQGSITEQLLYEDIVVESLKIYGQDCTYMPRELVNKDDILGDDPVSSFSKSYKLEMYIENTEGFDGEGDLFSKFGVEIRDEATFVVSRRSWNRLVKSAYNTVEYYRPREGDLIYLGLSGSIFQIMKVEDEAPFYQLKNLPTFKMRCQLFEYNDEDFKTGITVIDDVEAARAFQYILDLTLDSASINFVVGEYVRQVLDSATSLFMEGNVVKYGNDSDVLYIAHAGATNGTFQNFKTGTSILGLTTGANGIVQSVTNNQTTDDTIQNDDFDTIGDGFIDFSESNPFGDPS